MRSASIGDYKDALTEALRRFQCCKDHDVQDFLNSKAIEFEKRGWATTYLVLSQEHFERGELVVEGYFSLTHKAVIFDTGVSLSSRKKLTGQKQAQTESFVLIGQLGKRMEYAEDGSLLCSCLSAANLLRDAMLIIQKSSDYIISRNVIVECKPIDKVKKIYEDYGFTELQYDKDSSLYTLYLKMESGIDFS